MKTFYKLTRNIDSEGELNGIITYLNNNDNIDLRSFVGVLVSSQQDGDEYDSFAPLTQSPNKLWESRFSDHSPFYSINFMQTKVSLTGYGFRMWNGTGNPDFPMSWYVYGSNDRNDWQQIDFKERNAYFTDFNQSLNFRIQKTQPFRFFKFDQIGNNYKGSEFFCLYKIDLYGSIFMEYNTYKCTIVINYHFSYSLIPFILSYATK